MGMKLPERIEEFLRTGKGKVIVAASILGGLIITTDKLDKYIVGKEYQNLVTECTKLMRKTDFTADETPGELNEIIYNANSRLAEFEGLLSECSEEQIKELNTLREDLIRKITESYLQERFDLSRMKNAVINICDKAGDYEIRDVVTRQNQLIDTLEQIKQFKISVEKVEMNSEYKGLFSRELTALKKRVVKCGKEEELESFVKEHKLDEKVKTFAPENHFRLNEAYNGEK